MDLESATPAVTDKDGKTYRAVVPEPATYGGMKLTNSEREMLEWCDQHGGRDKRIRLSYLPSNAPSFGVNRSSYALPDGAWVAQSPFGPEWELNNPPLDPVDRLRGRLLYALARLNAAEQSQKLLQQVMNQNSLTLCGPSFRWQEDVLGPCPSASPQDHQRVMMARLDFLVDVRRNKANELQREWDKLPEVRRRRYGGSSRAIQGYDV
jgi:hypothetical protein